ncbi:hypothetical protein TNCV_2371721 [Trichonephila clavipes]|nr:hypothetical protein TNCV_2371721 [Trichonephila clavipes]
MCACGKEFHIACMRSKSSSFEAAGCESRQTSIDEADISRHVAVDQRAAKCLEETVGHSPPCRVGVDCHALKSPSVVHCQFFELFGARRSTVSKLASLWNCSTAHELLLHDSKILLLESR